MTNESSKCCAARAISSTARLNASSFARDGFVNPESFRTNWSDEARISSVVAGGEKLCRVLMARHMKAINRGPAFAQDWGETSSTDKRISRDEPCVLACVSFNPHGIESFAEDFTLLPSQPVCVFDLALLADVRRAAPESRR